MEYLSHQASQTCLTQPMSGGQDPNMSPYREIILAQWQGWGLLPILLGSSYR